MSYTIKAVAHLQGIEGAGTVLVYETYQHRRHAEQMMMALIGIDATEDHVQCTLNQRYEPGTHHDDRGRSIMREIVLENATIRKVFTLSEWR